MKNDSLKIQNLKKLARISPFEEAFTAIEEIAEYRSRRAVRALASLMKLPDDRGEAAMYALIDLGTDDVADAMLACLDSRDDDHAWRAQQVLSAVHGADIAA